MLDVGLAAAPTNEIRTLIAALNAELAQNYLPVELHGLSLAGIFQPHIRFFVARRNGQAVGCGGIALFDGFAEVKRMFVTPQARGQRVARAILARLETEALAAGLSTVRLETGDKQDAAMRLYEAAGFFRCGAFGAYALMPPEALRTSVFYEKRADGQG